MKRRWGLSLTETIVALFLIGVIVVVLANLFPSALASLRQSEDRSQSSMLAESLLAEQLARPFEDLALQPETNLPPVTVDNVERRPSLEIFQVGSRDTDYIRGVRVRVRWQHQRIPREVVHEVWVSNLNR